MRKGRIIAGLAVALVVVVGGILAFRACSPMTIASWGATRALEAVVGEHATVSAYVVDHSFSSPPRCELKLAVHEDTTVDELAGILSDIVPSQYTPCEVIRVDLANRASLYVMGFPAFTTEQWAAVVERLSRGYGSISVGTDLSPAMVSPHLDGEDTLGFIAEFHAYTAGDRLEDSIGPIWWGARWTLPGPPYHSVDVETSGTPPTELEGFLEALVPVLAATDTSVSIRYRNPDTGPVTHIEVLTTDPPLEAEIAAAFAASGLPGELTITYGKTYGSD